MEDALEDAMIFIDTLSYAKRLESAGVPAQQAEAHAMALSDVLMTQVTSKSDLAALAERLMLFIKEQIAILRGELAAQKVDMFKLILASALGQTAAIIAAIRYLPH